ncbi:INO80 complex subunit B-like [Tigriopus californicus]|uniref:INO80 complex subunit B-like n=1 Tax=Tigriopus californicus TaxID=6832 RepID=UPI0027DA9FF9|nr:INO80 complex subunit B-like [Tigriopus californicus]
MAAGASDSDSDSESLTVDVGADPPVDDSICIVCRTSTYIGQTINCETCALWFHFGCVGVKPGDDVVEREDMPYFCPDCVGTLKPAPTPRPRAQKRAPTTPSVVRNRRNPKNAKNSPSPRNQSLPSTKTPVTPKKRGAPQATATVPPPALASPPIKLKISFGPKTSSSSLSSISSTWAASAATPTPPTPPIGSPGRRRVSVSHETQSGAPAEEESGRKRRRRKSQDEEEKWLDAVEAGNMTAVDPELKSIKDPKLMTARQRAMVEKQKVVVPEAEDSFSPVPMTAEGGHMALDYGYKKKELDTEESLQLKAIKSQKRKVIEMEKRENDKKKTMDRLLKKKDSKAAARQTKSVKSVHRESPKFSYTINHSGQFVSVPVHATFPFKAQPPREPPPVILCAMPTCGAPKKYQCARSGKPLCSLPCYKANQLLIQAQN